MLLLGLAQSETINAYCFYNYSQNYPVIEVDVYSSQASAKTYKEASKYMPNILNAVFMVLSLGAGAGAEAGAEAGEDATLLASKAAIAAAKDTIETTGKGIAEDLVKGGEAAADAAAKAGVDWDEQAIRAAGEEAAKNVAESSGKTLTQDAIKQAGQKAVDEAAQTAAKKVTMKMFVEQGITQIFLKGGEPAAKAAAKASVDWDEQAIRAAGEEAAKNAAESTGKTLTRRAIKQAGQKAVDEAAQTAAKKAMENLSDEELNATEKALDAKISEEAAKPLTQKALELSKKAINDLVTKTKQDVTNLAKTALENLKKLPDLPAAFKNKILEFAKEAQNLTTEQVKKTIITAAKLGAKGVKDFLNETPDKQAVAIISKTNDLANAGSVVAPIGQVVAGAKGNAKAEKAFTLANRIFNDLTMPGNDLQELYDLAGAKIAHHEIITGTIGSCWNWKDIQKNQAHPNVIAAFFTSGWHRTEHVGALYFEVTDPSSGKFFTMVIL